MRKFYSLLLLLCLFTACKDNNKNAASANDLTAAFLSKILGSFVGEFGENKITLLITKAEKGIVEGRTVVGGNDRPFTGTLEEKDGIYSVTAKEPGDDENDGTFAFKIEPDLNILSGTWQPFDKNKKAKEYKLVRREFQYRTDVGAFPEASQRQLKPEDLENMTKSDLELMRNEIFARHGYCFKKKTMREEFEEEEWYIPNNTDIRAKLTPVEKKNIELIKRYEKYAEDYGDEFGR
jgi:hypothetical protein